MKKTIFDLRDLSFYPDKSTSRFYESSFIEWNRTIEQKSDEIFFTDLCLNLAFNKIYKNRKKIALLIEPIVINKNIYDFIYSNYKAFDMILTHHKAFLPIPNSKYYFFGGCWIDDYDCKANYKKTKSLSMISSSKNFAHGHFLRHKVADIFKDKIDLYGSGYKYIDKKIDGLKDYRYQIVIENCREPGYHTEKIIDCFMTGVIPIYYGSETILEFFDKDGIILFNQIQELDHIINNIISDSDYENRKNARYKNFEVAKNYRCAEDTIFVNYFK